MAWIAEGLHRIEGGHLVPAKAVVPSLRSSDPHARLTIGHDATIQGGIEHAGGVILSPRAQIWAHVHGGHEVIVGPDCHVKGNVHADGRIVVQAGARIEGSVTAGSDVLLLGDCDVGPVSAVGDIVIVGSPKTGGLSPGGRITTRPW